MRLLTLNVFPNVVQSYMYIEANAMIINSEKNVWHQLLPVLIDSVIYGIWYVWLKSLNLFSLKRYKIEIMHVLKHYKKLG